jgi:hypothetical protein
MEAQSEASQHLQAQRDNSSQPGDFKWIVSAGDLGSTGEDERQAGAKEEGGEEAGGRGEMERRMAGEAPLISVDDVIVSTSRARLRDWPQ